MDEGVQVTWSLSTTFMSDSNPIQLSKPFISCIIKAPAGLQTVIQGSEFKGRSNAEGRLQHSSWAI